jgi:predicted RNA polymerase sigma factor
MNQVNETALAVDVSDAFAAKVRAGMFAPVARHLREDLMEDRLAEGIGMAFEQYVTGAAEGRVMPDALLVRACHLRAIDLTRRLAGADGAQPKKDVYDERAFKEGHVDLLRLDGVSDEGDGTLIGFAEPEVPNPARKLASAVDLERWVSGLGSEDRLMLALRQGGHTLTEIGTSIGRSTSFVFGRLHELGRELAERAGLERGYER